MPFTSVSKYPGSKLIIANNGGIAIDVRNTTTSISSANSGTLTIWGDLNVIGSLTSIQSTNTEIKDNIIVLNKGESNPYVSLGTSGIEIDRSGAPASLLYNDSFFWKPNTVTTATILRGIWEFQVDGIGSAIRTTGIRPDVSVGNYINFLGEEHPTATLNVAGTTDYEQRVLHDDDIPNKKYVDDKLPSGNEFAKRLLVGGSSVTIFDSTEIPGSTYYSTVNRIRGSLGNDSTIAFEFYDIFANIQGLEIRDTDITVKSGRSSNSMKIKADSTGTIQFDSPVALIHTVSTSTFPVPFHTSIYARSAAGPGGSGVYFVNNVTGASDEFVSKKKAVIFSIIF